MGPRLCTTLRVGCSSGAGVHISLSGEGKSLRNTGKRLTASSSDANPSAPGVRETSPLPLQAAGAAPTHSRPAKRSGHPPPARGARAAATPEARAAGPNPPDAANTGDQRQRPGLRRSRHAPAEYAGPAAGSARPANQTFAAVFSLRTTGASELGLSKRSISAPLNGLRRTARS